MYRLHHQVLAGYLDAMAAEVGTVARDNDDDTDDANAGQVAWFTQVN